MSSTPSDEEAMAGARRRSVFGFCFRLSCRPRRPQLVAAVALVAVCSLLWNFIPDPPMGWSVTKVDNLRVSSPTAWMPIRHRHAWVYSAFYDERQVHGSSGRHVVLMALVGRNETWPLVCHLGYPKKSTVVSVGPIEQKALNPLFDTRLPFSVREWMLLCPLDTHAEVPSVVCVSSLYDPPGLCTPWLPVVRPQRPRWRLSWCVSPLHGPFDDDKALAEALELARLLGVQRVTAYNHSVSPVVAPLLQRYVTEGFVELLPWTLPFNATEVFYFGQVAAINDCLYRHRGVSGRVLFHDLDEVMLASNQGNLTQTIAALPDQYRERLLLTRHAAAYVVPHSEFAHRRGTLMVDDHWRSTTFLPHRVQSKLIVNPSRVVLVGVHQLMQSLPGTGEYWVDASDLFVAHFHPVSGRSRLVYDDTLARLAAKVRERLVKVLGRS